MAASRSFTLQEVAEHAGENDPYMVIRNKVYDCTSFLKKHPGGKEVLLEVAGTDATEAYEEVGHGGDADKMLKRLYIGELIAASVTATQAQKSSEGKKFYSEVFPNILILMALVGCVVGYLIRFSLQ